jgi:hypothetical protein
LCSGGGGWWVLKVNLVISFGFGQAEQLVTYFGGLSGWNVKCLQNPP